VIARRCAGAGRALYEPLLQRMHEMEAPGLLMSGNREEGSLFGGVKPAPQPAGRGVLVRRADGVNLVQTAYVE
jgi:DNA segregation ATPase FtsK/SpoIIIE, S-DNA-T family